MGKRTAVEVARDTYNIAYRNYLKVEERFYKGQASADELSYAEKDYIRAEQTLEYVETQESLLSGGK